MKNILCIIILILITTMIFSQKINCSLANEKSNEIYCGIDNPFIAIAEKYSCDLVSLTSNNGTVMKLDDCKYVIHPSSLGTAEISMTIKIKNKIDTIGKFFFKVKQLFPEIKIYGLEKFKEGKVPKDSIKQAMSIIGYFENFLFEGVNVKIINYRIIIIRDNKLISIENYDNPVFDKKIKNLFNTLEKGDIIIFDKINYIIADGKVNLFHPIEYEIK